jgi:hypothetical protein
MGTEFLIKHRQFYIILLQPIQTQVSAQHFTWSRFLLVALVARWLGVLATGPKGFEPGQVDEFLSAIKIRSTPSFRMGIKAGDPTS